jgi:hypothetical protein
MTKFQSWGLVAALLVMACFFVLLDFSWYGDSSVTAPEEEEFVSDVISTITAQLDDPVGFKGYWLQQQGFDSNKSSIEAVRKQRHRDEDKRLAAQLAQPGVICTNTCFKV